MTRERESSVFDSLTSGYAEILGGTLEIDVRLVDQDDDAA